MGVSGLSEALSQELASSPPVRLLTLMLTSSLKADFCSSKARLESAILVSAMNFTSSISFLHSAS